MSRAYTKTEVETLFLDNAKEIVRFWSEVDNVSTEERIHGALFGIFTVLDGDSVAMPGFSVVPRPHKDDRAYHEGKGEKWFPDDVDIAGDLHNQFARMKS